MTGNIALDIFIGLIFVYLLYSLFAAVLVEIISTWIWLRSNNLYRAISTMLNDAKESKFGFFWFLTSLFGINLSQRKKGLTEKFYKTNGIKTLGGSIYKASKPSVISTEQFVKSLFEVILTDQEDTKSQAEMIRNFLNYNQKEKESSQLNELENSESSLQYMRFLFNQSYGDIEKFKALLRNWFEDMMIVARQWYKQRMQIWLFIVGFILAFNFNLNSLYITKVLSLNNEAREQMVQLASAYLENNKLPADTISITIEEKSLIKYHSEIQKQAAEASNILSLPKDFPQKIHIQSIVPATEFITYRDSINKIINNSILSYLYCVESNNYVVFKQPIELPYINIGEFVDINCDKLSSTKPDSINTIPDTNFNRAKYFWRYQLWGFVITALAISLGAPFWYDLLNKIMQLKSVSSSPISSTTNTNYNKNIDENTPNRVG